MIFMKMIYNYDVDHNKQSPDNNNNNNTDVLSKVQIEMDVVNNKKEIFEDEYIISDIRQKTVIIVNNIIPRKLPNAISVGRAHYPVIKMGTRRIYFLSLL
ncbi:hypothetical protein PFTANZ_00154 [Plasmodium falciparum Tanzania (2000708)]|uniref:Plasmodium falciparum erythrocyte membrane protein 1 acidic terminal segment domain-containing protein n=1 Tax=Plasmodium falciparum Tanzania (2000708) TaxID=1036725 RepID=A0A024WEU9_PLAFA|nr:hypothetical protein PFTANZ_00154 [Plasmodium falciparum Tanzania (2000708)]